MLIEIVILYPILYALGHLEALKNAEKSLCFFLFDLRDTLSDIKCFKHWKLSLIYSQVKWFSKHLCRTWSTDMSRTSLSMFRVNHEKAKGVFSGAEENVW